jgi:hypothetical protein
VSSIAYCSGFYGVFSYVIRKWDTGKSPFLEEWKMKAGKGFCTWHSCLSVAVVGALAFAVSVQGSPRAGERGDKAGKSGTSRLVSGPSAQLNDAIAGGGNTSMALVIVAPKTQPASNYPGGSNLNTGSNTLTLGSVPARVWMEVQFADWDPDQAKTFQARISAQDLEMDGGGFMGSAADCAGNPAVGAGDITNALHSCATNTDCRNAISGLSGPCALGEPSRCVARQAWMPPGGNVCEHAFQDKCDSEWTLSGIPGVSAVDISTINARMGATSEPPEVFPAFDPLANYGGTLVVDVPANAKGTYTIDFDETETFIQNPNNPPDNNIPIDIYVPAVIKVGCGSCCFGVGGAAPGCTDGLSASECAALAQPAIFTPDGTCLNPPTDDGCCACLTNAQCNDNDACTNDICNNCVCSNPPVAGWDPVTECCNATDGSQDTLGCADQCEAASCTLPGNRGDAQCLPRTGESCNDENPCTYADTCAGGAGSCAGLDANAVACTDSADCPLQRALAIRASMGSATAP